MQSALYKRLVLQWLLCHSFIRCFQLRNMRQTMQDEREVRERHLQIMHASVYGKTMRPGRV